MAEESKEQAPAWRKLIVGPMSPYRLAQVESAARGEAVRPQKIYAYVGEGRIPAHRDGRGKWEVAPKDAIAHVEKTLAAIELRKALKGLG